MTEDQIEIWAERKQDRLDKAFMREQMTEEQYRKECDDITLWVEQCYEHLKKSKA